MKKALFLALFAVFFLFFAGAMELELIAGTGNMAFDPKGKEPLGGSIKDFEGNNYFTGSLGIKGDPKGFFSYNIRLERDLILQNYASGKITFDTDYLYLEAGPFAAMCENTEEKISAGIIGNIRLAYPGKVFLSAHAMQSFDSILGLEGEKVLQELGGGLGFWFSNFIPVFSVNMKSYEREADNGTILRDELLRFQIKGDIFAKNFPLIFKLGFSYDIFSRIYTEDESSQKKETTEELKAMTALAGIKWQITKPMSLILDAEMPFFPWAHTNNDKRLSDDLLLYKINAGFTYKIF